MLFTVKMNNEEANKQEPACLDLEPSRLSEVQAAVAPAVAHDAVFGDITEDGPNYRDVSKHLRTKVVLEKKTADKDRLDGWERLLS
jgi:hypothetical protein